jgi:hypothetical protein
VKEPVVLPFVFLLVFIAALAVFSCLDIFSSWGSSSAGVQEFSLSLAAQRFAGSALQSLVPATVAALLVCGFRASRRSVSRFLSMAILLVMGYAVMVNGMFLFRGAAKSPKPAVESARLYVPPRAFFRLGDAALNARSVTDAALKAVLVYRPGKSGGERLSVHPSGRVSMKAGSMTVALDGASPLEVSGALPLSAGSLFEADALTAAFLRDMGVLTEDFRRLNTAAPAEFFLAAFAFLFLCTSSMAILRFTRWPLVNALFLITAVRAYFLLYHFLSITVGPAIGKGVTDPLIVKLFPSIAFMILGVLFLIVDIVFIPNNRMNEGKAM